MRDRADIEREYSKKLDSLGKKYTLKFEKRSSSSLSSNSYSRPTGSSATPTISTGHNITLNDDAESSYSTQTTSVSAAWKCIIDATEQRAKAHLLHSDSITSEICDKIKLIIGKKDNARKKHMLFSQKLASERDATYADKDKCKKNYDDACESVEAAKVRYDRATDDKSREKYKLAWHNEILDMNNCKNLYILAIAAANAVKNEYFAVEVPGLLRDLHCLSESVFESLRKVWENFAVLESNLTHTISTHASTAVIPVITAINPQKDTEVFVLLNPQTAPAAFARRTPKDYVYIPSAMWRDFVGMAVDEYSRCFMINKLVKVRRKLEQVERDLAVKTKGIEGMELLYDVYLKNPDQGDMDDVFDTILEIRREYSLLASLKARLKSTIDSILDGVGDSKESDVFHNFQNCSFGIPTTCNHCRQVIWGVGKPGLSCKECGFNAHLKCELKVAPTCSQTKTMQRSNSLKVYNATSSTLISHSVLPAGSDTQRRSDQSMASTSSNPNANRRSVSEIAPAAESVQVSVGGSAVVLYDYAPEASNAEVEELAVMEGEIVKVLEIDDGGGWTKVLCDGKVGLIPSAYIKSAQVEVTPVCAENMKFSEMNEVIGFKTYVPSNTRSNLTVLSSHRLVKEYGY
ncbi:hypothetical protein BC830DRAFT_72783 [Chytriomyces sp. MP71]|nr:hypothetical protein BC830DRAFT_72783 [Chytriomyces sp. MP71]